MRLTPANASATWVAGVRTFVLGGAVVFLAGASGALLAALGFIGLRWEQTALMTIGAVVALIGLVIPRKRAER